MIGYKRSVLLLILQVGCVVQCGGPVYVGSGSGSAPEEPTPDLITQTVYGFLDFTTTIANTVMVFSPQSQPPALEIKPTPSKQVLKTKPAKLSSVIEVKTSVAPLILSSKVEVREATTVSVPPTSAKPAQKPKSEPTKKPSGDKPAKAARPEPPRAESSRVEPSRAQPSRAPPSRAPEPAQPPTTKRPAPLLLSSKVEVLTSSSSSEEHPALFENNLDLADELLSKQPSELIEETYKVVETVPTSKPRSGGVTGLVTKLGGTVVKEGVTTVHETSVIGTYISGKYAQILKSSSHVVQRPTAARASTPGPGPRSKAALEPSHLEDSLPLEALFTTPPSQNLVRQSRRPALSPPFKNRLQRTRTAHQQEVVTEHLPRKSTSSRSAFKLSHNRFSRQSASGSEAIPTVSVFPESASASRRYHRHRTQSHQSSPERQSNNIETGRRFKPKPSPAASQPDLQSTSLYKFKLSRPQGRWQYKSSPKPRVAIRRQDGEEAAGPQPTPGLPVAPIASAEIEQSEVQPEAAEPLTQAAPTPTLPIQTIKVDISTPPDFSNVYYEIATIKSPYTFQVGTVKNTRYITVTSTQEKLLIEPTEASSMEPLTENILTTKPAYDKDPSVATLPPIAIAGEETLPLETMTETFSTSEILLKTHLLPVVRESNTSTMTLVQTYEVTKLVTATKTLPPTELFQFIPSKTLNEFNTRLDEAGSELHLELEFGDSNNDEEDDEELSVARALPGRNVTIDQAQLMMTTSTSTNPPPFQEQLSPEKLQQLAFLRLLNPNQAPVVTSTPILTVQTVYESHVIPVFNGLSTVLSTISRPVGTLTNTQYVTSTLPLPSIPLPLFPTQQLLQPQITSTPIVTQTIVTETQSKVLKLTFGAKTAFTTLYSTKVVPTLLTTYLTAQVPVQPTQQFPNFFPPFNPFNPYVG